MAIKGKRKISVTKKKPTKASTEKTTEKKVKARPKAAPRQGHGVDPNYGGASKPLNKNRSRTVVPNEEFGNRPDMVLTERTQNVLAALKSKYKGSPWPRNDLDAGVLKNGIRKGHVEPVQGDGNSESDTYKFTKAALSVK